MRVSSWRIFENETHFLNERKRVKPEMKEKTMRNQSHHLFWGLACGTIFILFGMLFMLENFGFVEFNTWDILWPTLLILWGVSILFRPKRVHCCCYPRRDVRIHR